MQSSDVVTNTGEPDDVGVALRLGERLLQPEHFDGFPATYQIAFFDRPALDFHFRVVDGRLELNPGVSAAAALGLRLEWDAFERMADGRMDVHDLTRGGRLAVEGDVTQATPLLKSLRASGGESKIVLGAHEIDEIIRRAPPTAPTEGIERRAGVSPEELMERYAKGSRPLILTDLMGSWPVAKMDLDAVRERIGHVEITTFISGTNVKKVVKIADYVDGLRGDSLQRVGSSVEYAQMELPADVVRSLALSRPPYFDAKDYVLPRLWLGPTGAITHLHYDDVDNFLAQVFGEKLVTLYHPDDYDLFAPQRLKDVQGLDPDAIDRSRFPLARHARKIQFVLAPGEVLFNPGCWYHHIRILSPSLSVNFFLGRRMPAALW